MITSFIEKENFDFHLPYTFFFFFFIKFYVLDNSAVKMTATGYNDLYVGQGIDSFSLENSMLICFHCAS